MLILVKTTFCDKEVGAVVTHAREMYYASSAKAPPAVVATRSSEVSGWSCTL